MYGYSRSFKLQKSDNITLAAKASKGTRYTAPSWNIEGLKQGIFTLKHLLQQYNIDFAFISEPQLFKSDSSTTLDFLSDQYCFFLNSKDLFDRELPQHQSNSYGETLLIWHCRHDPFVTIIPPTTCAFTVFVFHPPAHVPSIYYVINLPTHGKDSEFISDLAALKESITDLKERYPEAMVFVRGDSNVNPKNEKRLLLFSTLLHDFSFTRLELHHHTYYHFVGNGSYDSQIDVILHDNLMTDNEAISFILCSKSCPDILSHHDAMISTFSAQSIDTPELNENISRAPRIERTRMRIEWNEMNIHQL